MGMYTELHFNCELKKNAPLDLIKFMCEGRGREVEGELPDHPLFLTDRWQFMLNCDSYYFPAKTNSRLIFDSQNVIYLNIQCNLKNYSGEIEKFIDWIMPYCAEYPGDFLGYYRYEESETPTLIHYPT